MTSLRRQQKRDLQLLTPNCDSRTVLPNKAEYVVLGVSLVGVPGLAVHNSRNINSLACTLAKSLNATPQALDTLNQELRQVREATLKNRAAIDYLLLRHNDGCKEFRSMCSFNLTENSQLIEGDIEHLKELVQNIGYEKFPFDLTGPLSWLPDLHWLKALLLGVIAITILGILFCCLSQCIPPCLSNLRSCLPSRKHPSRNAIRVSLMMFQKDKKYSVYSDRT